MATLKKANISKLWLSLPDDLTLRLEKCITESLNKGPVNTPVCIFFRADDIGVPGTQFERLAALFKRHKAPLSLAVTPAWLTSTRWSALLKTCRDTPSLWCWHQHGWRHKNHEKQLKKQEFGPSRTITDIENDLNKGRDRLATIMKRRFYPMFTPPWNRCSDVTLELLVRLGYHAVSRSQKAKPVTPATLPDIAVNVDLHTRRESRAKDGWKNLFDELGAALSDRFCGIMIHHRRMNETAFDFLNLLLEQLMQTDRCRIVGMPEIVQNHERFLVPTLKRRNA
jgi:peptidoglycan/xylan/chitin deacetylase (PgdA/CDA1 family)